jgi:flagellar basal body-associated protein FliL
MSTPTRLIEKALIVVIVFLVLVIAVTTVWVLMSRDRDVGEGTAGSAVVNGGEATEQSFTGIGRLRAVLKEERGGGGSTVIIRVVFPYDAADTVFIEELARNIGFFRETISAYFAAMTAADPRLHDEAVMKAELLDRFNTRLRLGTIDQLFFSEFLIVD